MSYFLIRPTEVVRQLTVEFRWEFTRRHPYYLQFWQPAREFREQPSTDEAIHTTNENASETSNRSTANMNLYRTLRIVSVLVPVTETSAKRSPKVVIDKPLTTSVWESSGEGGIRTPGRIKTLHRFSKPAHSATLPPLRSACGRAELYRPQIGKQLW